MGTLQVLDKARKADMFSEGRASAAPEEVANFLERAEAPSPGSPQGAAVWFYSVPLPGVRYFGYEGHPSPSTRTKLSRPYGTGGPPG